MVVRQEGSARLSVCNPRTWSGLVASGRGEALAVAGVLAALVAAMFVVKLLGPPDVRDAAQHLQGSYVLDVVQGGNWLVQRDATGSVMSKPPLYTWLAAAATLPFGELNRFSFHFPAAVATWAAACAIYLAGRAYWGGAAGVLAAVAYVLSPAGAKQAAYARPDGWFALAVIVGAVAGFRAWQTGRGWAWFWAAAAVGTLAKGPLCLLLAAAGFLAYFWERRSGRRPLPAPAAGAGRGSHWVGVGLYLVIVLAWFVPAMLVSGRELYAKMILSELVGESVGQAGGSRREALSFLRPTLYLAGRFAPWIVLTAVGVWRVLRHPAEEDSARRFERFVVCGLAAGLVVFGAASHQRPDLMLPLVPAAALLAGRELARLTRGLARERIWAGVAVAAVIGVGLRAAQVQWLNARSEPVVVSKGMKELARSVRELERRQIPVEYVRDAPMAVQFCLPLQFYAKNTRQMVTPERAAQMLLSGDPLALVVTDMERLRSQLPDGFVLRELARWPADKAPAVTIVGGPLPDDPVDVNDSDEASDFEKSQAS